ncbi:MAG: DNA repair protein RadA [Fidelibacterota bacterium]
MKKPASRIVCLCSECGSDFPKWYGKCPACGEWGTLKEFSTPSGKPRFEGEPRESTPLAEVLSEPDLKRSSTGIREVDRVLGGGILPGSVILLGGSPGIGKSTLALQAVAGLNDPTLYVSAEESEDQIALRARRLGIDSPRIVVTGENRWERIEDQVALTRGKYVVIDSIQTVYAEGVDSLPGAISQIRECGQRILEWCKSRKVTAVIIAHVTKEGVIAGPKMLEHLVDTVVYLEGDSRYDYRVLRAVKNRFGPTHEVGIFEMSSRGLVAVENPSELFLADRQEGVAGSSVIATMEGSRPLLVEVQALVSNATFGTPQRNVTGFDFRRLAMLLAVLEKRLGFLLGTKDVFVNLVGGMRIDEPAADLGVVCAIVSNLKERPLPPSTVVVGEVGLGGELRPISRLENRLNEIERLGFKRLIAPASSVAKLPGKARRITLQGAGSVQEALDLAF